MAKIEDLVKRISDKHRHFDLAFEEHLPEVLRLPKVPIRVGNLVVHRQAAGNDLWWVVGLNRKKARCRQPINSGKYREDTAVRGGIRCAP